VLRIRQDGDGIDRDAITPQRRSERFARSGDGAARRAGRRFLVFLKKFSFAYKKVASSSQFYCGG